VEEYYSSGFTELERSGSKPTLLTTCKNDNLDILARPHQDVEHVFNSLVVREGERVVENHRRGPFLGKQKFGEGKAG